MSTKHCIDRLLEGPNKSHIPESKIIRGRVTSDCDEMLKEEVPEYHRESNRVLHVPREYRRPIYFNPYLPQTVFRHSKPNTCLCQTCTLGAPPWLADPPAPRFNDKFPGYPPHNRQSYMAARWDTARLTNSTLVTRTKQQPCLNSAGGQKRKKRHRTAFTPTQLLGLENAFEQSQYSVGEERKELAAFLGLSETQIKVWFQNRRTKWKRIRKEAEEMSTDDDDEKGNEADDHRNENRYPEYQIYTQHHAGPRICADEMCECGKIWPTSHACSRADRC